MNLVFWYICVRPGTVMVKDSNNNDWLYIVKSVCIYSILYFLNSNSSHILNSNSSAFLSQEKNFNIYCQKVNKFKVNKLQMELLVMSYGYWTNFLVICYFKMCHIRDLARS